jgi:cardiolipin synthase
MNIPNFLTLVRIVLVPVVVIFLIQGAFLKALIVLIISGITDALDGFLARILRQQTVLGAYLDPIADKALLISCFVTLSVKGIIPGWLTVIVISRDVVILVGIAILTLMSVPFEVRPALVSKITTGLQLFTVLFSIMFRIFPGAIDCIVIIVLNWTTAVFTIVSGLNYMFRWITLDESRE